MKKTTFLIAGLFGIGMVGLTQSMNVCPVIAAEEKVVSHEGVMLPTRMLMHEIAKRMSNILEGTLASSFKYVAQEAGAIVDESYKINDVFFPVDPKENKWFKRAKTTFKAFTNMVEKTCFECHEGIRDKMIPIENQ